MRSGYVFVHVYVLMYLAAANVSKELLTPKFMLHYSQNALHSLFAVMVRQQDIVTGNKRLNLAFAAQIFNTRHGLDIVAREAAAAAAMEAMRTCKSDFSDSRSSLYFF